MSYLDSLNPQQKQAVLQKDGPLLILAGAGSGKTRVLTNRIAYLIEQGVPAWNILAITFTNKAAREMQERVERLTGESGADAWVSTFHSCCARILRRDIEKLGYKRQFSIYDEDDTRQLVKSILKELQLDEKVYPVRSVRSLISDAKNKLIAPREWLDNYGNDAFNANMSQIYERYEHQLFANDALDFDDLLVKTLKLLAEQPPVLDYYQNKFRYILVDEYQDTNRAQYELVRLLTGERHNLCVVGDDDQSIYGWRGADIRNILDFRKDFPEATVIKLEQNYRSTGNILEAANQVIAHNSGRMEKALWTESDSGEKLKLYRALDERDEAYFVAKMSRKLIDQGNRPGEIAVLYRTNGQSRVLEEAFVREGIRHRVYGAQRFYDRKEIKDLLAYMRVIANPQDNISVQRIINEPKRGIGDTTVARLIEFAAEVTDGSLMEACLICEDVGLAKRTAGLVRGFADLMTQLTEDMYSMPITDFVQSILDRTGYARALESVNDEESKARLEYIKEFQGAVSEFHEKDPDGDVSAFLETAALMTDADNMAETTGAVTLTTLHSAKGLEFDVVFLTGLEETIFPTFRALESFEGMEEERRLAYVGITRARKQLFICHARSRMLYNSRSSNQLSRFVSEIPPRLISEGARASAPGVLPRPAGRSVGEPSAPLYSYSGGPGYKKPSFPQRKPSMPPIPGLSQGTSSGIPGVQKGIAKPAAPAKPALQLFREGDRVYHAVFGKGRVIASATEDSIRKVTIEFDNGSKKRFSADIAPLKKITD